MITNVPKRRILIVSHPCVKPLNQQLYAEVQRIVAEDLPYINLWYLDNVLVHTRRVKNLSISPPGNYDFLKTAELASD